MRTGTGGLGQETWQDENKTGLVKTDSVGEDDRQKRAGKEGGAGGATDWKAAKRRGRKGEGGSLSRPRPGRQCLQWWCM